MSSIIFKTVQFYITCNDVKHSLLFMIDTRIYGAQIPDCLLNLHWLNSNLMESLGPVSSVAHLVITKAESKRKIIDYNYF